MIGSTTDTINLLSKTTWRRAYNAASVLATYNISSVRKVANIRGMPISIAIEPTTSCNLRCPECPSGRRSFTRPTGTLDDHRFRSLVDQLAPTLSYLTFYFQGEPFLHPRFLEMVRYAVSQQVYTATSTNGHFITESSAEETVRSGLDRLIISIDGADQETYRSYRIGGSLEKVIQGTESIVRWKRKLKSRTPHVVFQFLVVGPNEHQIDDVRELARSLSVDQLVLKTAQIYDHQQGSHLIPSIEKYSRYGKNADGTYSLKNRLSDHCWKMWHSCVVTWDGKVVPCCFDKDAHFVLGDLAQHSFEEIWFGKEYNQFRQSLLKSRKEIEICRNCTEGTRVWA